MARVHYLFVGERFEVFTKNSSNPNRPSRRACKSKSRRPFRRAPPQLDAVVRVSAHFEIPYAIEHVLGARASTANRRPAAQRAKVAAYRAWAAGRSMPIL